MAELIFKYGAMEASKSAEAIMTAYNYELHNRNVFVMKPSRDTRGEIGKLSSRAGGMTYNCQVISSYESIRTIVDNYLSNNKLDCIIVDECQFLEPFQVKELAAIVDDFDIQVICYGLKNSSIDGQLFDGSKALLWYADTIEEIKTLCTYCNAKATMNLRFIQGRPCRYGEVVMIGDTDTKDKDFYLPVCRKHYYNPLINVKE